jgi:hypothetical protein
MFCDSFFVLRLTLKKITQKQNEVSLGIQKGSNSVGKQTFRDNSMRNISKWGLGVCVEAHISCITGCQILIQKHYSV